MVNDLDKVIAGLRFLDLKPDIGTYKWRFIVQKTTHLAQCLGLHTKYWFTIYVAGPYSPQLTSDYYRYQDKVNALETEYELAPSEKIALMKIKECCNLYEDMSLMESTSTVVYLMLENPNLTDGDVIARIHTLKPHISESTRIVSISKAKELLFKPEYLTEKLKKEIEAWSKIDAHRFVG
jgi:hypothetical protein